MRLSNVLAIALLAASAAMVVMPATAQVTPTEQAASEEDGMWDLIRNSADVGILEGFLQRFPNGRHAADARAKLDALNETGEVVEAMPAPAASQPSSSSDVVMLVQMELQRAGCSPGTPDGDWGGRSRAALTRFVEAGNIALSTSEPGQQLLDQLRTKPGVVCTAVVAAPTSTERPASAEAPVAAGPQAGACTVVKVRAAKTKPNGKEWDVWAVNGAPEPDIVISERNLGLSARCDNSFTCQLKVPNAPATLSLKIIDYDNTLDETLGKGSCELGDTCRFESATVTFGTC